MIAPVAAVGFDLDGTLVDTLPDLAHAVNETLTALGLPTLTREETGKLVGHGVERLVEGALAGKERRRVPAEQFYRALSLFDGYYGRSVFSQSRLYPDVLETLQALAAAGMPTCCITNKARRFTEPLLEWAGLAPHLRFSQTPASSAERKPSPTMLRVACERLSISPERFLFVGDSMVDLAAARAAGCPAMLVDYGYGVDSFPADIGNIVIRSIREVARATNPVGHA
jgi:phosphoglycolate phosphatase